MKRTDRGYPHPPLPDCDPGGATRTERVKELAARPVTSPRLRGEVGTRAPACGDRVRGRGTYRNGEWLYRHRQFFGDFNAAKDADLVPGQLAYFKIVSLDKWVA